MAGFSTDDRRYMERALRLAEKGRGLTRPNPMVGAVIVKNGRIISEGYHQCPGKDHAEIDAIKKSRADVKGSTIYVTLEPCTVAGRTPPCADELIRQGFSRVVVGAVDPNPLVMGKGLNRLRSAGIEVDPGLFQDEVKKQNEVFFKNMETGLPFVCAKTASSIDGKMAAPGSDSRWITGPSSRQRVQDLRQEYGCVLTGINTIIADDPTLFPKKKLEGSLKQNMDSFLDQEQSSSFTRVILDNKLRTPAGSALVQTSGSIRTVVFTGDNAGKTGPYGNMVFECRDKGKWQPREIIKLLYDKYGVTSVMLEAGPSVLTSFLNDRVIDKFIFFIAPRIIGGHSSYSMFGDTGVKMIGDSIGIRFDSFASSGEDILIMAYPAYRKGL
jgi:diaminohydroxyphosphoribosylaminopyrimidine deaminase / 5-amino-6-(5-phosphoribosylamino)uracil reductase